ncbi:MAG: cupin domain-containing protein [Actinomycetota bacterium]|nr:cupin domain-containing protein [Actinomycetota bacterium]
MTAVYDHPHTIEDGAGSSLTFVGRVRDERGELLEVESRGAPGAGAPMHVHHRQEEALTVRSGILAYQTLGAPSKTAGPGATVTFAPGVAHKFWNAGTDELSCVGYVRPPDNFEYFLTQLYDSTRQRGGKRPGLYDAAFLLSRYGDEFDMLELPRPVRRLVLPLVARLGSRLGWNRRFADAPAPLAETVVSAR